MFSRLLLLLSLIAPLFAQQPDTAPKPAASDAAQAPQSPDSTALSNGDGQQTPESTVVPPPQVISSEQPEAPGNGGPGVLTRNYSVTPLYGQEIRFRPFVNISGIVDSGLTGVSAQNGQLATQLNEGVDLGFGLDGRRLLKKDTIELEFRGDLYHYTPDSFYDGGNYVLDLNYLHRLNRHVTVSLQENAGVYSNNYALLNNTTDLTLGNTSILVTPNTQIFDNTTYYFSTGGDVLYEFTPRLSMDFGGSGFSIIRRDNNLYGTTGAQARVDTTYRITRRTTVGPYYGFTQYWFNRSFGGSTVHTAGLLFSHSFTRSVEFRFRGGVSRAETNGIETITLDPTIAALLGYTQGLIAVHRTNLVPDLSAQLFKYYRVGTASVEVTDGVSPGNGLVLTSRHIVVSGHYDYIGLRRWTFQMGASRDSLSTLGVLVGQYTSYVVDGGIVRTLARGFQANFRGEYRHYEIAGSPFLRNSYRLSLGIAWTPEERPLKLF